MCIVVLLVGWLIGVGICLVVGIALWRNHLFFLAFMLYCSFILVADMFWPVVTMRRDLLLVHSVLRFPKKIELKNIARVSGAGSMIYLTTLSQEQIHIFLTKLSESDRQSVVTMITEQLNCIHSDAG